MSPRYRLGPITHHKRAQKMLCRRKTPHSCPSVIWPGPGLAFASLYCNTAAVPVNDPGAGGSTGWFLATFCKTRKTPFNILQLCCCCGKRKCWGAEGGTYFIVSPLSAQLPYQVAFLGETGEICQNPKRFFRYFGVPFPLQYYKSGHPSSPTCLRQLTPSAPDLFIC